MKIKDVFQTTPPKIYITVPFWDNVKNESFWKTLEIDELIKNPSSVNLEFVGLHFLNVFRVARGLTPLTHVPTK